MREVVDYRAIVYTSKGNWIMGRSPTFVQDEKRQQAGDEGGGFRVV